MECMVRVIRGEGMGGRSEAQQARVWCGAPHCSPWSLVEWLKACFSLEFFWVFLGFYLCTLEFHLLMWASPGPRGPPNTSWRGASGHMVWGAPTHPMQGKVCVTHGWGAQAREGPVPTTHVSLPCKCHIDPWPTMHTHVSTSKRGWGPRVGKPSVPPTHTCALGE